MRIFFRIFLFFFVPIFLLITGIYIGNAYAISIQKKQIQLRLNVCMNNIEKVNWSNMIHVEQHLDNSQLTMTYRNLSDCFDFLNIKTELLIFKNGISDTLSLTLKETVKANKKITIYIQQPNVDSVKILQSEIIQKSLNF
jgi:hypothetical protein